MDTPQHFVNYAQQSDSLEWQAVGKLVARALAGHVDIRAIGLTCARLAKLYHVPAVPVPQGMTWEQCRQRYAAYKRAALACGVGLWEVRD